MSGVPSAYKDPIHLSRNRMSCAHRESQDWSGNTRMLPVSRMKANKSASPLPCAWIEIERPVSWHSEVASLIPAAPIRDCPVSSIGQTCRPDPPQDDATPTPPTAATSGARCSHWSSVTRCLRVCITLSRVLRVDHPCGTAKFKTNRTMVCHADVGKCLLRRGRVVEGVRICFHTLHFLFQDGT